MAVVTRKDLLTSITVQPEYFSDFFTNLQTHSVKKDILRAVNEHSVKQQIKNLLLTNRGEHFFEDQNIGSDVRKQLFEQAGPATEGVLADLIRNMIENHVPHCRLLSVRVLQEQQDITATIVFSLINKVEPVTLEVILERVR